MNTPAPERRYLPLLLILFVGSGCAALIYEIVWFQMLQLVIGSTAVSLGVLLGTFMGGMCLGSLLLSRIISARRHPLRVYAMLELGIGVIGVLVRFGVPAVGQIYSADVGRGMPGILLRAVVAAICLLPPTLLMGATLPAIARWIESTPAGVAWLGFFYGANIAGAVLGCLTAGFYLLRVYDMAIATYVAVAINAFVALCGLVLASATPHDAGPPRVKGAPLPAAVPRTPGTGLVLLAIALSGFTALGAEVIWTRLFSLMLGGTVYTFSIILAVFLVGLGIGSSIGSYLARESPHPRITFGICQLLLVAAIAWTGNMISLSLPYWPIDGTLAQSPWFIFQIDLARTMWGILPAAILWGASFPLALAGVAAPGQDPGRLVGGVYAANTVGAILGALLFSLYMIPAFGTMRSQQVLMGVAELAMLLMLLPPVMFPQPASERSGGEPLLSGLPGVLCLAVVLVGSAALIHELPPIPAGLIGYGHYLPSRPATDYYEYAGEGMNSSIAVSQIDGITQFHVSGKVEASTDPLDMRLQRMLGHLPALLHTGGEPQSVLIVGCGAGVTAGTFVIYPSVKNITLCEIEPLIPKMAAKYFGEQNYHLLDQPSSRLHIVYDDARNFIFTTREKFDIITSDPIHPWVKGAATLYTEEYFEQVKAHLNPGGLVTQWVPLYESTPDVVKSEIETFFKVFPHGTIWSNDDNGGGYDVVLLGEGDDQPKPIDLNEIERRLASKDYQMVDDSLKETHFKSVYDLLSTCAGDAADLKPWLAGADINHDLDLRLQYLAGFSLNKYVASDILDGMLKYYRPPVDQFTGTPEEMQRLQTALDRTKKRETPVESVSRAAKRATSSTTGTLDTSGTMTLLNDAETSGAK